MNAFDSAAELRALALQYAQPGPRYTSYPTAADFSEFSAQDYVQRLARARRRADEPWSVYLHIPFCAKRCTFCACSVIASPEHDRVAAPYVEDLIREIALVSRHIGTRRRLAQLHLGGGTPTYLAPALLSRVFEAISREFVREPGGEWSIEIDARATSPEHIDVLGEFGVNRVSLGVQDLDPEVQRQIGRVQSTQRIIDVIRACRRAGVRGVNLDLIYGLPGQSRDSLRQTIDGVLELGPDRLALYGYAHLPWMPGRGNQRGIDEAALPSADARLDMFLAAREQLLAAGYQAIGMDHFARPEDPLAKAEREGLLGRNFMGYTVVAGTDMLGFGVTAIGDVAGSYVQNTGKLSQWQGAIAQGQLPTARGLTRSPEDALHGAIIADLMCRHHVDKRGIEAAFADLCGPGWRFDERFGPQLAALRPAVADGLLVDTAEAITLTEVGKLFVRNIAMAFDARLRAKRSPGLEQIPERGPELGDKPRFSATV